MSELTKMKVAGARDALRAGEVTSVELTEACLEVAAQDLGLARVAGSVRLASVKVTFGPYSLYFLMVSPHVGRTDHMLVFKSSCMDLIC